MGIAAFGDDDDEDDLLFDRPPGSGVTTEVIDPPNDFVDPTPFDQHQDPIPAVDLAQATVTVDGDKTIIRICFHGPARDLVVNEGDAPSGPVLGFDLLLNRPPSSDLLNIRYNGIGDSSKPSDPPRGVSSQHRWVSSDCIEFTIQGWTPDVGSTITIQTLASSGSGPPPTYSKDVLEISF